jgi:hypothetical protein
MESHFIALFNHFLISLIAEGRVSVGEEEGGVRKRKERKEETERERIW